MKIYEFGSFKLKEKPGQLLFEGREIYLQPKTLQLLLLLVEDAGKTITREDLLFKIWGGQIIDENNISQRIFHLRRALGEHIDNQRVIVTVPGIGYRFNIPVTVVESELEPPAPDPEPEYSPDDLSPANQTGAPTVPLFPRFQLGTMQISIFFLLCLVTAGYFVYRIYFQKAPEKPEKKDSSYIATVATLPGTERYPAISTNGKFIAFSWDGGPLHNFDIYIKMLNEGEVLRVTSDPAAEQQPAWSPDGNSIAFLRAPLESEDKFRLIVTPTLGGNEREVGQVWGGLDWSPDGKWLAVSDNDRRGDSTGIYLTSLDGSQRRALSRPAENSGIFDTSPSFSPDGRQLVFIRWISDAAGDLFLINTSDGRMRQLTFDQKGILSPKWTADGQDILFVSNRNGNRRVWQISASGGPPALVENIPLDVEHISLSRIGSQLAFTQSIEETSIDLYSAQDPGKPSCQINSSRPDSAPQISPDGKSIVFESQRSGWNQIWTASIDCTNLSQITNFEENIGGSPRWSPDGKRIAFARFIDGQSEICTIGRDGTNYQRVTNNPSADIQPAWSIDGKSIYFSSQRTGRYEIYQIPAEGGSETQVTVNGGSNGILTFDGLSMIFNKKESLHKKNLQTGEELPIPELVGITVGRGWDLTPQAIFYTPQKQNSPSPVYRYDLRTGKITMIDQIRKVTLPLLPALSVSKIEDRIAISYLNFSIGDLMLIESLR